jgi:acyl carrier protein
MGGCIFVRRSIRQVVGGLPRGPGASAWPGGACDRALKVPLCCEITMSEADHELQSQVARLIVAALNLDLNPDEIEPDAPLYGEGLGLDSIDILEVALVVSKRFGFQLRADNADNADNVGIFSSLASLTEHIAAARTK